MAKVKVKVKPGSKGTPLGKKVVEIKEGKRGKLLYQPKAKMTVHIHDGRE
jgi:hypothetical protein